MINKRKIIYFLITIVVGLLFINVLLGIDESPKDVKNKNELSLNIIEKKFIEKIEEFGIEKSWILKKNIKKGRYDSLKYKFSINIPSGVAIPVVLKDINEAFANFPVKLVSSEKKNHGFTNLIIKSGGYTKLISDFNYKSNLDRKYSNIGFLVTDFADASEADIKTLLELAMPIGIVLPLAEESRTKAEVIKNNKFEYFVELKSSTDNIDFDLDDDLGLDKLNKNIRNIISSFNSPKVFFINKIDSEFNPSVTNFILEGFQKKGREVRFLNNYFNLRGENLDDLKSLINFHLNKLKFGSSTLFRIGINDWINIQDEINSFVKKGNKIVLPTKIF